MKKFWRIKEEFILGEQLLALAMRRKMIAAERVFVIFFGGWG